MTKQTNHVADMMVIETKDMAKIEEAIKNFAFDQKTQCKLLDDNDLRDILDLYMSLRKLGKQAVTKLIIARDKYEVSLIRAAVIGNSLSEFNEGLLIENYPELVEEYLISNPEGQHLSSGNVEKKAKEAGLGAIVDKYPRPHYHKAATQSMTTVRGADKLRALYAALA